MAATDPLRSCARSGAPHGASAIRFDRTATRMALAGGVAAIATEARDRVAGPLPPVGGPALDVSLTDKMTPDTRRRARGRAVVARAEAPHLQDGDRPLRQARGRDPARGSGPDAVPDPGAGQRQRASTGARRCCSTS